MSKRIEEISIELDCPAPVVAVNSLNWGHGTSIDIDIRVNLDARDCQASSLQKQASAGGNNALANTGDDTCGPWSAIGAGVSCQPI